MKHQLATINRSWASTLDKNLNLDNLAKVQNQWTVKYRSGGHGSAGLKEIHPQMKYLFATINRSWESILDKNLKLDNLAKVQSQWTVKYRSWGHGSYIYSCWSHIWNINLLPLIGIESLPWTKMLTWSTDRCTERLTHGATTRTLYAPGSPRPQVHKNIGTGVKWWVGR